jgi:S-adenosylmethionine synthetase
MSEFTLFTSESVTEGHPDKICDQISDAILDAVLAKDPQARVAAECIATTGLVLVTGEISTRTYVDIPAITRRVIKEIGYDGEAGGGFAASTCAVLTSIDEQSIDIARGVSAALEQRRNNSSDDADSIGAGDQGIIFGYACNETPEYLPLPIAAAHRITQQLALVRKNGVLKYLGPDGKAQVTVEYANDKPVRIHSVVVSTQHAPSFDGIVDNDILQERIANDLKAQVIAPAFRNLNIKPDERTIYYINPSGRFVTGGPQGDTGLTGRKVVVDTYGGYARHGGGAFSGKDPTKVDRTAAYATRHIAKNIVAAGLAKRCEVQIAYAIGVAQPVSVAVTTFGTGSISDAQLAQIVRENCDLRPSAIISRFRLRVLPAERGGRFYQDLASYGHFGRPDLNLPWEELDFVEEFKNIAATQAGDSPKVAIPVRS